MGADDDGRRVIDNGDYDVRKTHFGQTAGSGSVSTVSISAADAIPEPATWALFMFVAAGICARRRRPT